MGGAIRNGTGLLAQVPFFEAALARTEAYRDHPRAEELAALVSERFDAAIYTLPPNLLTMRVDRADTIFSYDDDSIGLYCHGRAGERGHNLIVPGCRVELSACPPFNVGHILFSTLDPETMESTRQPRIYVGIGLAALANRVKVWGEKQRDKLQVSSPSLLLASQA